MKSLTLALLLIPGAAFAGPWYELINGTMSLTGVLGIAASSSTPKNYVLQLNGPGGYIQFPDGTKQTTSASAGMVVNSTNTWTGANTFTGGFSANGIMKLTSSATFTNAASITFSGLSNTKSYHLRYALTHLTASTLKMIIGGRTSAYKTAGLASDSANGTGAYGSGVTTYIQVGYPTNTAINFLSSGTADLYYGAGVVWVTGKDVHWTGSIIQAANWGATSDGDLTSIGLITSSGNISGNVYLFEVVP